MLVKEVLNNGGVIVPLMLPEGKEGGIMNPSIYNDNGKLLCNIRHVKYTIYSCYKYAHQWGPLTYLHKESDRTLRTVNYMAELDSWLNITKYVKVDTSAFDQEPKWEFIGLEDARLFRWEGKLYQCGVRRDTTTNGQGRMELSELDENYKEISRRRIPAPGDNSSYCEKNWIPVLDQPYTMVKWTNPTEIVNIRENTTSFVKNNYREILGDIRGGSQVVPYKDKYIAIMHETILLKDEIGRKDARYLHKFVVWNKNWDIEYIGNSFTFLEGNIEFCTGAALFNDSLLVSFAYQDNAAYILKIPLNQVDKLCNLY
jgi:hypothetical protein